MPDDSQAPPRDTLLHVADLHFWHVTFNPLRLLNKRVLGNFNVWWRRRHQFAMDRAVAYIDELKSAGTPTVLFTGDFTSTSLDAEFLLAKKFVDTLREHNFEMYVMPGNHDVYTFESVRARRFEKHFADFSHTHDLPVRVDLPGGTPMILVPTVCPNLVSSQGRITDAEVARVRQLVMETPDPLIVAGHYPLLDKTAAYELTRERRMRNAAVLREALGASGKRILYVAGHVHRFSYVRDTTYPNLLHLCTGTFFGHNKREGIDGEFARITIDANGFGVTRHVLKEGWNSVQVS